MIWLSYSLAPYKLGKNSRDLILLIGHFTDSTGTG